MIKAINIIKSFDQVDVLKGVTVNVNKGEVVAIVGPSGAGKTTLIQIMGTLMPCDEGKIFTDGVNVTSMRDNELSDFRNNNIGFVFQFHHLLPEFTALENVMMPALIKGVSKKEAKSKALEILSLLDVAKRASHKPSTMSGGEQQRVAVARAIINSPKVLFADEPSGNLDTKNKRELHRLFFRLREELEQTIVIVTHDDGLADMADRCINIVDGLIVE